MNENEIEINGYTYIKKELNPSNSNLSGTNTGDQTITLTEDIPDSGSSSFVPYKIIRTYSAGVFAGYLESLNGKHAIIKQARRIWYWKGASSLSQLAIDGVKYPDECKFPEAVSTIELTEVIEILDCTEKAKKSIENVKIWKQ